MATATRCTGACLGSRSKTPTTSPDRGKATIATLVIETATAACSAALLEGRHVLAAAHEVVGRGHAERLVPMIAELIEGRPRPEMILVDCGPGSFTGVRVGLAAARAFGLGWGVEVRGYSSLALLAMAAGDRDRDRPVLPRHRGEQGE